MAYLPPLNGGRVNATISGNTAGAGSLVSTGTLTLAGGNNIVLSQAGNAITISGSNQTNQTLGLYGLGNTTQNSSTTLDARSMSLNGLGAMTVGYSNNSIQLSAPSVSSISATGALSISSNGVTVSMGVPAVSMGMSNIGNTTGTSGTVSNQLILAGGNNVTLSQSTGAGGNTISVSGVSFSNLNGLSFGLNAGTLTASHNGLTSQSNQALSGSNGSFTFQTATFGSSNGMHFYTTNGSLVGSYTVPTQTAYSFSNANGVSFGTNVSTVTASVATTYAASNHSHGNPSLNLTNISGTTASASNGLTLSLSAAAGGGAGLSAGTQSVNTGTVRFSNSNGITFGMSGSSQITASHNGITSQTNQTMGLYGVGNTTQSSSTTIDARSLSFNGLGAMSVGYSNGSVQVSGPSVSSLSATGIVSLSYNAGTISIGASQSAQTQSNIQGIIASGSTNNTGNISFANSNGITFGLSNNTVTASVAGGGGGVAVAGGGTTFTSGTANFVASGALTIASTTGQSLNFSVPATSSLSATGVFSISTNGSTISMGVPAYSAGISNGVGNTSGTTGFATNQLVLAGGNNITLSQATGAGGNTLSISAASQTVQTQNLHNLTLAGNSTSAGGGYAQISSGTLTLAGGNNITLSQNGNAVTIVGGAGGGGGGISLANSQTTYSTGAVNLVEAAGAAITIASTTGQSFNISVPATSSLSATGAVSIVRNVSTVSIGAPLNGTISNWEPAQSGHASFITVGAGLTSNSLYFFKLQPQAYVSATQLMQVINMNVSSSSNSSYTGAISLYAGIYTANGSTLSLITQSSGTTAYQWTNTSNNSTASLNSVRGLTLPISINMSPGNYWLGLISRNAGAFNVSNMMLSVPALPFYGILGQSSHATQGIQEGAGLYSTSATNLLASVAMSSIIQSLGRLQPYLAFKNMTY